MNIVAEYAESSLRRSKRWMREETLCNAPVVEARSLKRSFPVSVLQRDQNHHLLPAVLRVAPQAILDTDRPPVVHRP